MRPRDSHSASCNILATVSSSRPSLSFCDVGVHLFAPIVLGLRLIQSLLRSMLRPSVGSLWYRVAGPPF